MAELEKAQLQKVKADTDETPMGDPIKVQFNPNSLKLHLQNQVEGARSRGRQRRQQTGTSSTTLSMELIFDSADETEHKEGSAPTPVSVRKKTAMLEEFLLPKRDGSETPPRVRFEWKEIIVAGVVESLDIDFDLFAPDGTPLRAKTKLTIKEQNPKYQFLSNGPGARNNAATEQDASSPGGGTNDAGGGRGASTAEPSTQRSAQALEGETPPEFAARVGLDPAAWRGLDLDPGDGLSLSAGLELGFSAGLSLSAGIGLAAGFEAGIDRSLEASLGLEVDIGAGGGKVNDQAGFALSSAGGVVGAIEQLKLKKQAQTGADTREAFPASVSGTSSDGTAASSACGAGSSIGSSVGSATGSVTGASLGDEPHRPPLVAEVPGERISRPPAAAAPPPPLSDPRANAYGRGIPLRPLIQTAAGQRQPTLCRGAAAGGGNAPSFGNDAGKPPWERLPTRAPGRAAVDQAEQVRYANPCLSLYGKRR